MVLVRKLYLTAAQNQFSVSFKHIYGQCNPIADAISRFQAQRFQLLAPDAEKLPTPLPSTLLQLMNSIH